MQEITNIDFGYAGLEEAFPPADPGITPFGSRVLVQIRSPKTKTKGGIILTTDMRETEHYNTQIAKVIAVGPVAFKNRTSMEPWPEGEWVGVGDFVRVPKYGGDRWAVRRKGGEGANPLGGDDLDAHVIFALFNDLDLVGKITGDPLAIRAFV